MPRKKLSKDLTPKAKSKALVPETHYRTFGTFLQAETRAYEDPTEYIEASRLLYVKEIEEVADAALERGDLELRLTSLMSLVRLSSLHRLRLDVAATDPGLMKQPDLSKLTPEELEAVQRSDTATLAKLANQFKVSE